MKKRIAFILAALIVAVAAHAQFEKDKVYIGGSLTGLNLSYNGMNKLNLGVQAVGGYMLDDNLMLLGQVGYEHNGNDGMPDKLSVGVGGRYYIEQNGIFLGVNARLIHANHNYNDFMPGVEVGYAFFVSRTVTIEPALYYYQSFKDHSDYSTIGLRIGVGIYL
ncbi:MAG TPA: outer membrane beta-barrel protein [Prevotella sp.]